LVGTGPKICCESSVIALAVVLRMWRDAL
jgi:hypothetical protein